MALSEERRGGPDDRETAVEGELAASELAAAAASFSGCSAFSISIPDTERERGREKESGRL